MVNSGCNSVVAGEECESRKIGRKGGGVQKIEQQHREKETRRERLDGEAELWMAGFLLDTK